MRIIAGFKCSFSSKITRNLHSGVQIVHSASSLAFYAKSFPCLEFLAHRNPWQSQPVKLEEPHQFRKPNLPAGSVTGCATCIAKNTQQVTIRTNFMSLTDLSTSGLSAIELCTHCTPTAFQFGPHPRAVLAREDLAQHVAQLCRSVTFSQLDWDQPGPADRSGTMTGDRRESTSYSTLLGATTDGLLRIFENLPILRTLPLCNLPPVRDERVLTRSDCKATGQYFTSPPQFSQWINLFPDLKVSSTKKPVLKQRMVST